MVSLSDSRWPALQLARAHQPGLRRPFRLATPEGVVLVGSVALAHLDTVSALGSHWRCGADGVLLDCAPSQRSPLLAQANQQLREQGQILGWRNEAFDLPALAGGPPLARIERAAARFWGSLTLGAHCNGYRVDATGRPSHLWIARRALDKATDPGRLDNLIGGGVGQGQTPFETLLREGFEEAGLDQATLLQARPTSVLSLLRDVAEGLQREWLYAHDLRLEPGQQPVNQDGEVAEFRCLPVLAAAALAAAGEMTVDAELVTLDFLLRHRLLPAAEQAPLAQAMAGLRTAPAGLPV